MKLQNKLILLGLSAALAGGIIYSRIYTHEKSRKEVRDIAREIALSYKEKLNLSPQQAMQLEKIIIASTVRKNQIIKSNLSEVKKIAKLQQIQVRENRSLKKVLGEKQFLAYVGINKKMPVNFTGSFSAS